MFVVGRVHAGCCLLLSTALHATVEASAIKFGAQFELNNGLKI